MGNQNRIGKHKNPIFNIWPYSLSWELWKDEDMALNIVPKALIETLDTLTEREAEFLIYRFKDFMTYEEIGKKINRSKERARQTIAKAIRKLQHPSRSHRFMTVTRSEYQFSLDEIKKELFEIKRENSKLIKAITDYGINIDEPDLVYKYTKPLFYNKDLRDVNIEELELSVRAYNCLKRAGIETVADLMLLDEDSIMKIRNLGRMSLEEIIKKMEDLNIPFLNNYPEDSVMALNCGFDVNKKLVDASIYTIDDLIKYSDDDLICMGIDYRDVDTINTSLMQYGKELKKVFALSKSNLPEDIIEALECACIKTFDDIYSNIEYEDQFVSLDILDEKQAGILKTYLINRGRPLKRRPNPIYTKTKFRPDGDMIEDLGITLVIVNILKSAGINTIDELCSHTFSDIMKELQSANPSNANMMMNELSIQLGRIDRHLKFTKEQIRNIKIMNAEISFFTKSILNLCMIYTVGDLLDYEDLDGLRKREGKMHEIDKLIEQANKMLADAV